MPNYGVFAVEQFGILRWKANAKTNLLMVSKLKYDAYSPSNHEICLNNPNRSEKPCVCSVQYVHGNHHTLLLTSRGLASKDRKLVFTLKLLKSQRMLWGRVKWFSLFLIFKNGHIAIDWLYFMSSIQKNWQILLSVHATHSKQIFYFQKIIETLKMNIFLKICRNLHFTSKNNCKK